MTRQFIVKRGSLFTKGRRRISVEYSLRKLLEELGDGLYSVTNDPSSGLYRTHQWTAYRIVPNLPIYSLYFDFEGELYFEACDEMMEQIFGKIPQRFYIERATPIVNTL